MEKGYAISFISGTTARSFRVDVKSKFLVIYDDVINIIIMIVMSINQSIDVINKLS